jgi:hypothetical protein
MKQLTRIIYSICCLLVLSCNWNGLKEEQAENTIRHFLAGNKLETPQTVITPETIAAFEKTNVFTQFNTSVKVHFNNRQGTQSTILRFIFTRTPKNKWFLTSVEAVDEPTQEIVNWFASKKKLDIELG